jgi:T5orf172 domain
MSNSNPDRELLAELGVELEAESPSARPVRDERIIAGFEEIQRFVEQHQRTPEDGEGRDIFERLYAVRLERLHSNQDYRSLLQGFDRQKLLGTLPNVPSSESDSLDDRALLAELGAEGVGSGELTRLEHVRPAAAKRAADEIASRKQCAEFSTFKSLFDDLQGGIKAGIRKTRRYAGTLGEIAAGRFYILGGQKAYVAAMGPPFLNEQGNRDARLRVIYDNGTESNLLMRSLQKALKQDDAGRTFDDPSFGPLFAGEEHAETGTIYVLRSKSSLPAIAKHRDILHKIGVTGGDVAKRIANARLESTYLMADVEVVATYTLYNLNHAKLEHLIHRLFSAVRLDVEISDGSGNRVRPVEWFLVPRFVIDEAIKLIENGTITDYVYDPETASLKRSPFDAS